MFNKTLFVTILGGDCRCDYDIRVYFDDGGSDSFLNNHGNIDKTYLRYNVVGNPGPGNTCTQYGIKKAAIVYLNTSGSGPHPLGVLGRYVRVTIG